MKQIDNYINHVLFVLDASGSMNHLARSVIQVIDAQVQYLAQRSREMNQETRVTVFAFGGGTKCLVYDKDVLRLPSLAGIYQANMGCTALRDAVCDSVKDLQETPQRYGDHAFLGYVLTDGIENASRLYSNADVKKLFRDLPGNWTIGILVPDQIGVFEAKSFGFPADNISVWSTTQKGVEEVGRRIRDTTDSFMQGRTQGVRSIRGLWKMDTQNLNAKTVKQNLECLDPKIYELLAVKRVEEIRPFIERASRFKYIRGGAFYQLTKPEQVQPQKMICVRDTKKDAVYGGAAARDLLGLPDATVKVLPEALPQFEIYIQSTSTNRKLMPGTPLLVFAHPKYAG